MPDLQPYAMVEVVLPEGECLCRVSTDFAEQFADWEGPVDFRVVGTEEAGFVEVEIRKAKA